MREEKEEDDEDEEEEGGGGCCCSCSFSLHIRKSRAFSSVIPAKQSPRAVKSKLS